MSDIHETRTAQTDSVSTFPRLAEPWKPVNNFEEDMSKSLRLLEGARRGYYREIGQLSDHDQRGYQNTLIMLREGVQKVIWIKEFARLTGEDELPGIELTQDGVHAILTIPFSQYHRPMDIPVPIGDLDEDIQNLLPPLSTDAVSKGIEDAEEKVKLRGYAYRHEPDDDSWNKLQDAIQDRSKRILVVIRAKKAEELPEIQLSLSEDGEKVVLTLPPRESRTEPLPIDTNIKALETVKPNIKDLLALRPTSPQG